MKEISLTCPHCGGNQFIHPTDSNLDSEITCASCKMMFLTSDLANIAAKKEAIRLATEMARAAFGKMLK